MVKTKLRLKPEELKTLRQNLLKLKLQLMSFQGVTLHRLANEVIIDEIHRKMRDASPPFSEKIILGTQISDVSVKTNNRIRIFFTSQYEAETGFDVALAREKGTDDHKVMPLPPTVERPNPHLKWIEGGTARFSKGHEVTGFPSLHIIEETLDLKAFELQIKFNIELNNWIAKNIGGDVVGI